MKTRILIASAIAGLILFLGNDQLRAMDSNVEFPNAASSSTVTGTGASPQVAVFTGAHTIAGDPGFTYNAGTDSVTINGALTVDTATLVVDSTNNFVGINKAVPAVTLDVVGEEDILSSVTGIGLNASVSGAIGNAQSFGGIFQGTATGTGTNGFQGGNANYGSFAYASGATAGDNVGSLVFSQLSSGKNFAGIFKSRPVGGTHGHGGVFVESGEAATFNAAGAFITEPAPLNEPPWHGTGAVIYADNTSTSLPLVDWYANGVQAVNVSSAGLGSFKTPPTGTGATQASLQVNPPSCAGTRFLQTWDVASAAVSSVDCTGAGAFASLTAGGSNVLSEVSGFGNHNLVYVDKSGIDDAATYRGTELYPYLTIQGAINQRLPAPTTQAQYDASWVILAGPGDYTENLTIHSHRSVWLVSQRARLVGSVTYSLDNTERFGSVNSTLIGFVGLAANGNSSVNGFLVGDGNDALLISNNVTTPLTSPRIYTNNVLFSGRVLDVNANSGTSSIGAFNNSTFSCATTCNTDFSINFVGLSITGQGNSYTSTQGLSVRRFQTENNSAFDGPVTVVVAGSLTPSFTACRFDNSGTKVFTGAASSLLLDASSYYTFILNGWTLGGAATRVISANLNGLTTPILTTSTLQAANTVHTGTLDQQGAISNSTGDVSVNDNLAVTNSIISSSSTGYPVTLTSIALNGNVTTTAVLDKTPLPARAFTVTAQRINVSVAGNTGSTNVVLRVSDGTNNCDASFACNATAGAKRPTLSGTCAFAASVTLTFSINSGGDCVTPAIALGNLDIEGVWQ